MPENNTNALFYKEGTKGLGNMQEVKQFVNEPRPHNPSFKHCSAIYAEASSVCHVIQFLLSSHMPARYMEPGWGYPEASGTWRDATSGSAVEEMADI